MSIRLVVPLIAVALAACSPPRYERWMPNESDFARMATLDLRRDFRGHTGLHVWEDLLEDRELRNAYDELYGMPSNGKEKDEDRRGRYGRKEFIAAIWRRGPDAFFNSLKIRGYETTLGDDSSEKPAIAGVLEKVNAVKLGLMYRDEFEEIDLARGNRYAKRIGLALSGGGIRSASFATGVLLGLHEIGVLKEFGYLSTVSGGGYAGAWFQFQERPDEFLAAGSAHLHHLAQNGNYLTSSHYSDQTGEFLGKALLHIALLPGHWLFNGVFDFDVNWPIFRYYYRRGIERGFLYDDRRLFDRNEFELAHEPLSFFTPLARRRRPFWIANMHLAINDETTPHLKGRSGDAFELTPLRGGSDAVGYVEVPGLTCTQPFILFEKLVSPGGPPVLGRLKRDPEYPHQRDRLTARFKKRLEEVLTRRATTTLQRIARLKTERFIAPQARRAEQTVEEFVANESRALDPEFVTLFVREFGAALDEVGREENPEDRNFYRWRRRRDHETYFRADVVLRAAWKALPDTEARVIRIVKMNDLDAAYRALPLVRQAARNIVKELWRHPELKRVVVSELQWVAADAELGRRLREHRTGDSRSSGSAAVPSATTSRWYERMRSNYKLLLELLVDDEGDQLLELEEPHDWMRPNFAAAISGAAVDSQSLKQSTLLSYAINALNWDLGHSIEAWWDGWRRDDGGKAWGRSIGFYATSPVFIYYTLSLLSPLGRWCFGDSFHFGEKWHRHTQFAKYYRITDGGHFDNLGVYALVRRGCRLIVVSDAAADPLVNDWDGMKNSGKAKAFEDLRHLERLLYADFGVKLRMEWESFSVSDAALADVDLGPFRDAQRGTVFVGTIDNLPASLEGEPSIPRVMVIYIKAAYDHRRTLRESSTFIDAEKADSRDFPNESTGDQTYAERKVLAYRRLGQVMVLENRERFESALGGIKATYERHAAGASSR